MEHYPVTVAIKRPERSNRWLALATLLFLVPKAIILIPHLFILYILSIVAFICGFAAQFVVLFTGHYPQSLFDIVTGVLRWQVRVNAFFFGLTDAYPPFRMRP